MAEDIPAEKFRVIGKNITKMDAISRPSLSYTQDAWRRLKGNRVALVSMIVLVIYILLAVFAPIFCPYDMATQDADAINLGCSAQHWFGTDSLGRDLFVRVWEGARVSLSIGFAAAMINAVIGAIIGCISGYYGGRLDMFIMRLVDVLYGIPSLIVTMLVMMILGRGVKCLIIAMCIVGWIGACRFARGEMLRLKNLDFVSAARVLGVHNRTIIFRHILPNMLGLLITNLTMAVPGAIFSEAFLSFIGLGIAPPNSSWGVLAKEGINMLRSYPMQLFIPSFFICTTMLALNLLGDGLRDAFDPLLRGTD
jgi:oligopeptide transport system permease protein